MTGSGIMAHWPEQTGGAPMRYSPEVVELALWHVALHGGDCRRGRRALGEALIAAAGYGEEDPEAATVDVPGESTVRNWVKGRFRARYLEILDVKASELDGRVAATATELAIQIEEGERQAIKQTLAGLSSSNGVESSVILRNLSQSKKIQVEAAGAIRGRAAFERALPSLEALAQSMVRMGFATIEGDAEDLDEIPDVDLIEAGD
jgi:hypothetical protein